MVTQEGFNELNKKLRTSGLVMSSVPKKIRDEFVKFAEEEFADNYGACLKHLLDTYKLWITFMQDWNVKLDYIISLLQNLQNTPKEEEKTIRTLSGKTIKSKKEAK